MTRSFLSVLFLSAAAAAFARGPEPDVRQRTLVWPVRVVATFPGPNENYGNPCAVEKPETLLADSPEQAKAGQIWRPCGAKMVNRGVAPGLVLDFGRELHGALQIMNSGGERGMKVRVRFGESVAETLTDVGARGASNDHAVRDGVWAVPHMGAVEIGNTGFRFVRIDLVTTGQLSFDCVRAVSLMRPMKRLGAFACSDERLNRIWETAVHTVHLCCQDQLWDGIKRDRLVWMGDTHPETMGILTVFGADPVLPQTLDCISSITDPDRAWMNNMAPYTLWWVRNVAEWYRFTGDTGFVKARADYIARTLRHCLAQIRKDGSWNCPSRPFLDWPSQHDMAATKVGLQGLAALAFADGAELADVAGEARLAADCRAAVAGLRKLTLDPRGNKQAAALLALSGLRDPGEMFAGALAPGGTKGLSTFYGYYMIEAMNAAGEHLHALNMVRDFWGAMNDVGATSYWENFDVGWTNNCFRIDEMPVAGKVDVHGDWGEFCYPGFRHSLCHGWSCGPAAWCINRVLGVKPLTPGCRKLEVKPFLGDLEWAEGAFPLPNGETVKVSVRKAGGRPDVKVDAPAGVEVVR